MQSTPQQGTHLKVNLEFLHTVCDGDEDFIRSIIQTFVEDAPHILQRLILHAKDSNWTEAGLAAHQLKPSLQFIGLDDTLSNVKKIERCCQEPSEVDTIPDLVVSVTQDISQAVNELQLHLA